MWPLDTYRGQISFGNQGWKDWGARPGCPPFLHPNSISCLFQTFIFSKQQTLLDRNGANGGCPSEHVTPPPLGLASFYYFSLPSHIFPLSIFYCPNHSSSFLFLWCWGLCILGRCSTLELYPQPSCFILNFPQFMFLVLTSLYCHLLGKSSASLASIAGSSAAPFRMHCKHHPLVNIFSPLLSLFLLFD